MNSFYGLTEFLHYIKTQSILLRIVQDITQHHSLCINNKFSLCLSCAVVRSRDGIVQQMTCYKQRFVVRPYPTFIPKILEILVLKKAPFKQKILEKSIRCTGNFFNNIIFFHCMRCIIFFFMLSKLMSSSKLMLSGVFQFTKRLDLLVYNFDPFSSESFLMKILLNRQLNLTVFTFQMSSFQIQTAIILR